MLIKATFGACKKCKKKFRTGENAEDIEWTREDGAYHPACIDTRPTLLDMLEAETLADKLGFDDLPKRNKRGYIP